MEEKHLEASSDNKGSAFLSRIVKEFEEIEEEEEEEKDQEMKNVSS
jgi:CHASE3 domain sensor protein